MLQQKNTFDFSSMSKTEIEEALITYNISLTVDEVLKVQEILRRPPTLTECIVWSIEGSEHCSYKSSRPFLKQFITDAPNVMLGPSEDAGIVEIARDNTGKKYGIVISHESHNHPSQIVPYEGAATGIGGNVRDVCCMGAKVIAVADSLRFGDITHVESRMIADGVVSGIAGYANPIGVPNIAGDVYFDARYNDNCLVTVVTLGVVAEDEIIHSYASVNASGYNIILVGKATDNSGFGGASFASLELREDDSQKNKGAVQEPNAFLKRHLLKANYELFKKLQEKKVIADVGFKDLGAGGVCCASVELADAAKYGADIFLEKVPVSMESLHPSVILCSETQERFMWVASPEITPFILEHYNSTFALGDIARGAQAVVVGTIRDDGRYVVHFHDDVVVDARASDVTTGLAYDRAYWTSSSKQTEEDLPEPLSYNDIFLKILAHENIASRACIYERYDKQVQGISILEPGQADAGVMQPFKDTAYPEEIRRVGIALSVDQNPRYCKRDSYWGAVSAAVESIRNVVASGASPQALTDCLCFGNPEKPEQMNDFVQATRGLRDVCANFHLKEYPSAPIPIVSGNVSLYNESETGSIAPSPLVSCLGRLADVSSALSSAFQYDDSVIFMLGERRDECGASVYAEVCGVSGKQMPCPQIREVEKECYALLDAVNNRLVLSCHDISDGGVAVALAEMCFPHEIGCTIQLSGTIRFDKKLFSETGGFVFEVAPKNRERVHAFFKDKNIPIFEIGMTTKKQHILLKDMNSHRMILLDVAIAKKSWEDGLRNKLAS